MDDYGRIARLIRFLDECRPEQPGVPVLAAELGLTGAEFHQFFERWAGITPRSFLETLSPTHAKVALRAGERLSESNLSAGASVTLEVAPTAEWKSGGAGLEIVAGYGSSPFGRFLLGETERGICYLSFFEPDVDDLKWKELQETWPAAAIVGNDSRAGEIAELLFRRPGNPAEPVPVVVYGTPFQIKIWRALTVIPRGALTSYGRIATALGIPRAARAVGSAVARNSVAYLIPCHRVIRETGGFGQYRWGDIRKRAMLAYESGR